jgi:protease-4
MKEFIKNTLAATLGTLISILFLSFCGILLISILLISGSSVPSIKSNSILKIELNGALEERVQDSPLNDLLGEDYPSVGLDQTLSSIYRAAQDPNIKAIYLDAGALTQATPAMAEEIRVALTDFKKSGKPIISYGDNYSQTTYYICSAADQVVLNPSGQISWQGLVSEPIFYKDLLQRIGVKMQVFRVGSYKSAVEPFTSTEMSPANREQIQSYLNSIWNNMIQAVAESRHINKDTLNRYADEFLSLAPATEMVNKHLADTLLYREDMKEYLKEKLKLSNSPQIITPSDLAQIPQKQSSAEKIAVYYAFGDIVDNPSSMNMSEIASRQVCRDLAELADDSQIKAVVIRINSGGGSAYASEQIWHSIQKLKSKKPVIISMGGMAASGGYYMACAGNEIVALPSTLTGSIGIFGMIPDASNLLKEKLGLNFDAVQTNRHADFGTMSRPFNPEETALMQRYIESGYRLFLKRVSDGRNLTLQQTGKLAEGRVWTGEQALKNGLVDQMGTLQTALERAAKKAGITDYSVTTYPKPQKWYESLLQDKQTDYIQSALKSTLGNYYEHIQFISKMNSMDPIQARMPYEPNIN